MANPFPRADVFCLAVALMWSGASAAPVSASNGSRAAAYYHFLTGALSADEGNLSRALSELAEAARLDQGSAEIRVELAGIYLRSGDLNEAVAQAREAVARDGADPAAHRSLAEALTAAALRGEATRDTLLRPIEEYRRVVELGEDDPETLSILGKLEFQADMPEAAAATFQRMLRSGGDPVQAQLLAGRAFLKAGRKQDALEQFEGVLQRDPRHVEALSSAAALHEEAGQWIEAARRFQFLADIRPSDSSARFNQAVCLLRGGQPRDAVGPLRLVLAMDPENSRAQRALAMALGQSGRPAEALERYGRLLEESSADFFLLTECARLREERNERKEAVTLLGRALTAAEADTELYAMGVEVALHLASLNLVDGRAEAVMEALKRAERLGAEGRVEVDLLRGRALLLQGDAEDAERVARAGRERSPSELRFLMIEAEAAGERGQVDLAEEIIARAIAGESADRGLILQAADMWTRRGEVRRALRLLEDASGRFPDDQVLMLERAAALERAGKGEQAAALLRGIIEIDANNHQALNYLGYMLAEQGRDLVEAQGLIERAVALAPDNGAYLDSLGWVLFRSGRAAEALEPLSRAGELLAGDPTVREHLGDVLFALGRRAEAEAEWRAAVERGGPEKRLRSKMRGARPGKPR